MDRHRIRSIGTRDHQRLVIPDRIEDDGLHAGLPRMRPRGRRTVRIMWLLPGRGGVWAWSDHSTTPYSSECARCGDTEQLLDFRRYRRVIGLGVLDLIRSRAGYFCRDCRRTLFMQWQGSTLLLGWWGVLALLFRNPYAIAVNFKALVAPPSSATEYGALTLADLEVSPEAESPEPGAERRPQDLPPHLQNRR
jgi:hypothetical protein